MMYHLTSGNAYYVYNLFYKYDVYIDTDLILVLFFFFFFRMPHSEKKPSVL